MKRLVALLALFLVLALALPACGPKQAAPGELQRFHAEFIGLFDTLTQVIGYAESKALFENQVHALKDDLEYYHQLYDIYKSYPDLTNLRDINLAAGQGPVKVDQAIIDLLLFAKTKSAESGNRVNIALGAVLSLWHDARERGRMNPAEARLPDMAALEAANRHVDIRDLLIDPEARTVEILDPLLRLDVGAVAKGYAVEQPALAAQARGVDHLLISVGGNVRAIGSRGDGSPWRVGIDDPDPANDDYLAVLSLEGLSLVTSGVTERYFQVQGKRYHHIIDPDSLFPEDRYLSVSIVCSDSGLADLLSTALFNLDLEAGQELIEALEGTEALWCLPDGSLVRSSGFTAFEGND